MKKAIVFIFFLTLAGSVFAIDPSSDPSSYVGQPVQKILDKAGGAWTSSPGGYDVNIDDKTKLSFGVIENIIVSVIYTRYNLSNNIRDGIISACNNHLGEPAWGNQRAKNWVGENVGRYFMNPLIRRYMFMDDRENQLFFLESWGTN